MWSDLQPQTLPGAALPILLATRQGHVPHEVDDGILTTHDREIVLVSLIILFMSRIYPLSRKVSKHLFPNNKYGRKLKALMVTLIKPSEKRVTHGHSWVGAAG